MKDRLTKAELWKIRLWDAGCTTLQEKRRFLAAAPKRNLDQETGDEIRLLRMEILIIESYLHAERMRLSYVA